MYQASVNAVHITGELYSAVMENLDLYVHKNPGLVEFIERLHNNGKTLFLVTNSPYRFMDTGMCYLIGPHWREYFDYVVVQAKKPRFFQDNSIPFRQYLINVDRLSYQRVSELKRGVIYAGGNVHHLMQMAGFHARGVLHFGDHIFSDLADPTQLLGWHTGAIVPELEREIQTQNGKVGFWCINVAAMYRKCPITGSPTKQIWTAAAPIKPLLDVSLVAQVKDSTISAYQKALVWLREITRLIEHHQHDAHSGAETRAVLDEWLLERDEIRNKTKTLFNPQFGSLFRTFHNPSYFSRRMMRLADVYTSRLPNMNCYGLNHAFYPTRSPLPHESHAWA